MNVNGKNIAADGSIPAPWSLDAIYSIEPKLASIAETVIKQKGHSLNKKRTAYLIAKDEAGELLGWGARNPTLKNEETWDCFFDHIIDELNI